MERKWVRAKDGAVCGVCKGVARSLDLPVGLVRLIWLGSLLFFGATGILYFMLAVSLPREDKLSRALEKRLLGVCSKIAQRTDLDVGIVRFLTLCLGLLSAGATIVGYVVLYFVLDKDKPQSSEISPSAPRPIV